MRKQGFPLLLLAELLLLISSSTLATHHRYVIPDMESPGSVQLDPKVEKQQTEIMGNKTYPEVSTEPAVFSKQESLEVKIELLESRLEGAERISAEFRKKIVNVEVAAKIIELLGQQLDGVSKKSWVVKGKIENLQDIVEHLRILRPPSLGNTLEPTAVTYNAPDFQTQRDYDQWLMTSLNETMSQTRIVDGASIGGRSMASISSSIPYRVSLTLELVNYLDKPLVDLETLVPYGSPFETLPPRVDAHGREVLVYRGGYPDSGNTPQGALRFRVGTDDHQLAIYFYMSRLSSCVGCSWFGMALAPFNTTFQNLGWASGSDVYEPSEVMPKDDVPTDYMLSRNIRESITISIENDRTYVKATLGADLKAIWKLEVFPKTGLQPLRLFPPPALDSFPRGRTYAGKAVAEFLRAVPEPRVDFLELANGLKTPLQSPRVFNEYVMRSTSPPENIPSMQKDIVYTTSNGSLRSLTMYQIGNSDIRLAIAFSAALRSGNKFGLKFLSSTSLANAGTLSEVLTIPKWERTSHKVAIANGEEIAIYSRNLRATASMTAQAKSLLEVTIDKVF